jgi:hypothetical protein
MEEKGEGSMTGAAFVVPHINDDWPEDLKNVLRARRVATVTGECPTCGNIAVVPNRQQRREAKKRGEEAHGQLEHEAWCPVSDEGLFPMLEPYREEVRFDMLTSDEVPANYRKIATTLLDPADEEEEDG